MLAQTPISLVCLFAALALANGQHALAAACVDDLELLVSGLDPGVVAELGRAHLRRAGPDAS